MIELIFRLLDRYQPLPFYTVSRTDTPQATVYVFIVPDLFTFLAKFKGQVCSIEPLGQYTRVAIAYPPGTRLRIRRGWWSQLTLK